MSLLFIETSSLFESMEIMKIVINKFIAKATVTDEVIITTLKTSPAIGEET